MGSVIAPFACDDPGTLYASPCLAGQQKLFTPWADSSQCCKLGPVSNRGCAQVVLNSGDSDLERPANPQVTHLMLVTRSEAVPVRSTHLTF